MVMFTTAADCVDSNTDAKTKLQQIECRLCDTNVRFDTRQYDCFNLFWDLIQKAWLVTAAKTEFFNDFLLTDSCSNLRDCLAKTFGVLLTKNNWCVKN